jgi:DNA-binding NarL/FixJ family response regulator
VDLRNQILGAVMRTGGKSSLSTHDTRPIILFIGDTASFSDMYIRLVQSEFLDIDILRVATNDDLRNASWDLHGDVGAVVVACRNGLRTIGQLQSLVHDKPGLRPVLAYQTVGEARGFLQAADDKAFVEQSSFLPLQARMDCTVSILRLVLSGERHVSGDILDALIALKSTDVSASDETATLTAREQEVLQHLARGQTNKVIARELDLAESTVKLHIHHIISKLGVSNRTEAAVAHVAALAKLQSI